MTNSIIVCERCRPGYQSSKLCLGHFRTNTHLQIRREQFKIVYANKAVEYSNCAACPKGTFSSTFLENQTCIQCSYCNPGYIVKSRCTSNSDTECIPQWNMIHSTIAAHGEGLNFFANYSLKELSSKLSYVLGIFSSLRHRGFGL